jgi:hypothetical protein
MIIYERVKEERRTCERSSRAYVHQAVANRIFPPQTLGEIYPVIFFLQERLQLVKFLQTSDQRKIGNV